ncbi:MAG: RAD55 family ATPase, partial [Candidatus Hodarchaeales archaeon]
MESEDAFRTGVQSLDLFLGGEDNPGLPNRSVILVLGEPSTKFELFTQQILYRIMKTGATDKVLYLSYDGRPQEIVEEMAIYDFQIQPYIDNNKQWEFMDAF